MRSSRRASQGPLYYNTYRVPAQVMIMLMIILVMVAAQVTMMMIMLTMVMTTMMMRGSPPVPEVKFGLLDPRQRMVKCPQNENDDFSGNMSVKNKRLSFSN